MKFKDRIKRLIEKHPYTVEFSVLYPFTFIILTLLGIPFLFFYPLSFNLSSLIELSQTIAFLSFGVVFMNESLRYLAYSGFWNSLMDALDSTLEGKDSKKR